MASPRDSYPHENHPSSRTLKGENSLAWNYPVESFVPRTKFARTHNKALGQPKTTKVRTIFRMPLPRAPLLCSNGERTGKPKKVSIPKYILEMVSLKEDVEEG